MKKIKLFLKILTIIALLAFLGMFLLFNLAYPKEYLNALVGVKNIVDFKTDGNIYNDIDNKMTVIYFKDNNDLEEYKYETLKSFITETDCNQVANFVDFYLDETDVNSQTVFHALSPKSSSNSVILLNKLGYKIESFSSADSIIDIENKLKEIFKNYL